MAIGPAGQIEQAAVSLALRARAWRPTCIRHGYERWKNIALTGRQISVFEIGPAGYRGYALRCFPALKRAWDLYSCRHFGVRLPAVEIVAVEKWDPAFVGGCGSWSPRTAQQAQPPSRTLQNLKREISSYSPHVVLGSCREAPVAITHSTAASDHRSPQNPAKSDCPCTPVHRECQSWMCSSPGGHVPFSAWKNRTSGSSRML